MNMYACRKLGGGYTIANSMEFRGVSYLEKDTTSIRVTKTMEEIFNSVGLGVKKEHMLGGSMWMYNKNIPAIKEKVEELKKTSKVTYAAALLALTQFMTVCINKGYDIRFY